MAPKFCNIGLNPSAKLKALGPTKLARCNDHITPCSFLDLNHASSAMLFHFGLTKFYGLKLRSVTLFVEASCPTNKKNL